MKIIGIIPARMGSTRFPGKPLAKILGLTMIEHVYKRCAMSESLEELYVATCDEEIKEEVERFGGKAIMTWSGHKRCTDRIAEAVESLDADIVVNIQGDEPLTFPEMVDASVKPLIDEKKVVCSNLTKKIESLEEFEDPNTIKVVVDQQGFALYFSREPIPTQRIIEFEELPIYKQVCVIPFRKDFLLKFTKLSPTPLEIAESIDMMRALEHGYKVKMVETEYETHAVDTPEDRKLVEEMMKEDRLFPTYR